MGEKERLYPKLTGVIGPTVRSMKRDIREKWRYPRYIRETEIKSRPRGGSRSNQYQSIKRFIPDRFPFRLFPQQFSIYLRHRNVCPPQNLLLLLFYLLSSTLFPQVAPLFSITVKPSINSTKNTTKYRRTGSPSAKREWRLAASCISSSLRTV